MMNYFKVRLTGLCSCGIKTPKMQLVHQTNKQTLAERQKYEHNTRVTFIVTFKINPMNQTTAPTQNVVLQ